MSYRCPGSQTQREGSIAETAATMVTLLSSAIAKDHMAVHVVELASEALPYWAENDLIG